MKYVACYKKDKKRSRVTSETFETRHEADLFLFGVMRTMIPSRATQEQKEDFLDKYHELVVTDGVVFKGYMFFLRIVD